MRHAGSLVVQAALLLKRAVGSGGGSVYSHYSFRAGSWKVLLARLVFVAQLRLHKGKATVVGHWLVVSDWSISCSHLP
jgi:F0F1-type ATP synthase assembly protein I